MHVIALVTSSAHPSGHFLKTDDGAALHAGPGLFFYLNFSASFNSYHLTPGCKVVVSCVEEDRSVTPGTILTVLSIKLSSHYEVSTFSRNVRSLEWEAGQRPRGKGRGILQSVVDASSALPLTDSPTTSDYNDNISSVAQSSQPYMSRQQLLQFYTENVPRGMNMSSVFMIVSICNQIPSISVSVSTKLSSKLFAHLSTDSACIRCLNHALSLIPCRLKLGLLSVTILI
jgi:hypothetical protein